MRSPKPSFEAYYTAVPSLNTIVMLYKPDRLLALGRLASLSQLLSDHLREIPSDDQAVSGPHRMSCGLQGCAWACGRRASVAHVDFRPSVCRG